jgi:hypothetical protein
MRKAGADRLLAEETLWRWFSPELRLRVRAFKLLERSRADRALFRVVISAEPDTPLPHGWRPGDNMRWVTLQRTATGRVVADVVSMPVPDTAEASAQPGLVGSHETANPAPVGQSAGES